MAKNIIDIVDRIKGEKGFKTDGEVASFLGMSKTALSNHKSRGTIPFEKMSTCSERLGVHMEWLLTGESPKNREKGHAEEQNLHKGDDESSNEDKKPSLEYDPICSEIRQFVNQVHRIYFDTDEISRAKLRILLAALDPGDKI